MISRSLTIACAPCFPILSELALFRHKLPVNTFYDTVMLAKRWSGPDALAAGIVQQVCSEASLLEETVAEAQKLCK